MANPDPLVSAVVPAFNAERFLAEAIDSVLSQTYPRIECVVVDDGSDDATRDIARSFGAAVRYVPQEKRGVSAARNHGVRRASGDLIAFLDADDVWLPHKIDRQVKVMATTDAALVYTGLYITDASLNRIGELRAPAEHDALRNTLLLEPPVISVAQTSLIDRGIFLNVGGFDERLSTSADTDLAIRIACTHGIAAIREPLALYRQHEDQMHRDASAMERDMLIVYERFFQTEGLDRALRALRRRAYGNLFSTLAAASLGHCEITSAVAHGFRAFCWSPPSLILHLSRALMPRKRPP